MAEILISNRAWHRAQLKQMCGESLDELQCYGPDGVMWPYKPYTIGQTTHKEEQIIRALHCRTPQNIHQLSATAGQENIVGVSEAMTKLHDTTAAMAGSTATAHTSRSNAFVLAVQRYQDTLLVYRDAVKGSGAAGATTATAGVAVRSAFGQMQKQFQRELRITAASQKAHARKGIPLTNITRAKNIARSSRSIEKLQLTSITQAGAVARFSRYGKVLGTGLVAIDFASRIGNVQNTYKADGNWEKELFIESSSFALSTWAGGAVVGAGVTFLVIATPVGWVGLIVTAAAVSMGTNSIIKNNAGDVYDSIMGWFNFL